MAKKSVKIELVCAPDEHLFWVENGAVLRDLKDLAKALDEMSDATFLHHVNKEKNDFANWVSDILHESKLASSLRKVKTKKSTLTKVKSYLEAS